MAEEWGCPPWEVEERLSCVWADRWAALNQARAQALKDGKTAGGGRNRKRLI